ncbi:MAG: hypothetical protein H6Q33_3940, partial [Deltaproteobacteria bacterium]|nr:hypothetical protein [Deltaproteobacteria bacterium]
MRRRGILLLALVSVLVATQFLIRAQASGGPILLIVNRSAPNPFGRYLAEILRAEGINSFTTVELSTVDSISLNGVGLVVLAETPLTADQAALLTGYVATGGRLVAMRPDAQLGPVLGTAHLGSTDGDHYVSINVGTSVGYGFPPLTLPIYGQSTRLGLVPGALTHATLYASRETSSNYPAVVQYRRTATWAYDLARSVVYARQGNPANAGVERDNLP